VAHVLLQRLRREQILLDLRFNPSESGFLDGHLGQALRSFDAGTDHVPHDAIDFFLIERVVLQPGFPRFAQ